MDGILVVDKPQGLTSHDVVDFVRKRFALKKAGHTGTLDPIATGVLVLLIGKYTKSSGEFTSHDKEYDATMVLGATSDTLDAWGKLTPHSKEASFTDEEIDWDALKETGWLYVADMAAIDEDPTIKLVEFAQNTHLKVAFIPGQHQLAKGLEIMREILSKTEILILNAYEAVLLTGSQLNLQLN